MTKLLTEEELRLALDRGWIVVWVTHDLTNRPYWTGATVPSNVDDDDVAHDIMWSDRTAAAFRYASPLGAMRDPELSDFWDNGDIACVEGP